MGHAGGKLAHRCQLFRPDHFVACLLQRPVGLLQGTNMGGRFRPAPLQCHDHAVEILGQVGNFRGSAGDFNRHQAAAGDPGGSGPQATHRTDHVAV